MHFWKSNICSNKLDVQETNFSFTQFNRSEIISLDAGLRLDGIPALDLWDLIISVLGNTIQTLERPGRPVASDKNQKSRGMTNAVEKH